MKWDKRWVGSGRYKAGPKCDCCVKPVGDSYFTDEDVCGGTDGPGFYLCGRKRCVASREGLGIDERRAIYEAGRAKVRRSAQ